MAALLEVQDLSVHFGGLAAVKNVTFTIEEGERLVMIGPNGAGKTTLFNLLTGQLKPSGGKVLFKGQDITHKPVYRAHAARHGAIVPDHQSVPQRDRAHQRAHRAAGHARGPLPRLGDVRP